MEIDSIAFVLSGAWEAGCFREVAALHSDHLRQVPMQEIVIAIVEITVTDRRIVLHGRGQPNTSDIGHAIRYSRGPYGS